MLKSNNQNINELLSLFPKKRVELPDIYKAIYAQHYRDNRCNKGLVGNIACRMESWMHYRVAEDIQYWPKNYSTLEIGGGTLNHLVYEPLSRIYDVVEPYKELHQDSFARDLVRVFFDDISKVSDEYDRIISIAAFEHIADLPAVIARCGILLKPGGALRVAVPAEGSIPWKLAYTFSTGLVFYIKHGLSYEKLMRHEHINNWQEIRTLLDYFFQKVESSYLGISPGLSLYHFYRCSEPLTKRCQRLDNDRRKQDRT